MKTLLLTFFTFIFSKVIFSNEDSDFLDLSDLKIDLTEEDLRMDIKDHYQC